MSQHESHYAGCKCIHLERFNLRPLVLSDDVALYALRSHPHIFKYVDIKPYEDIPRAQRFIRAVLNDIDEKEAYFWGIALEEDDYVIGSICIWNFNEDYTRAELGYELHPDFHKKGFMREAVEAILDFIRTQTHLEVLEAITHKDNMPSIKLLEYYKFKKLGIANEVRPDLNEGPKMLLYERIIRRS